MKKWEMKCTTGLILFWALFPLWGFSQITSLDWSDYPALGTSAILLGDTTGHVPVSISPGGADQVWDFQMPLSGRKVPYAIVSANATPYASSVPGAEWALQSKQWLSIPYIIIRNMMLELVRFWALGLGLSFLPISREAILTCRLLWIFHFHSLWGKPGPRNPVTL